MAKKIQYTSHRSNLCRMEIRVPTKAYKLKFSPGTSFSFDIAIDDADVKDRTRKLQIL